jgi:hypothetical protein
LKQEKTSNVSVATTNWRRRSTAHERMRPVLRDCLLALGMATAWMFPVASSLAQAGQPASSLPAPSSGIGRTEADLYWLRKLIEVAEGPEPTKESLEAGFGLRFEESRRSRAEWRQYSSKGPFPFSPYYETTLDISNLPNGSPVRFSLRLKFADESDFAKHSSARVCVEGTLLAQELQRLG